jgi:pimeloyl-ACP methyl ester carboxylesterase
VRSRHRWLAAAAVAAVVVAFLAWRALPARVDATPVVRKDVARSLVLTGRVRPPARPLIGASVPGTVRDVLVREGERVRAGQLLLAAFEPNPLLAIEPALRRCTTPTRMVWGTADQLFPVVWAEWLDRTLPASRGVRLVEGGRLFWPEERPDLVAEEARALWDAQD